MHRLDPDQMRSINNARRAAGKPMLSQEGFTAALARAVQNATASDLITLCTGFVIPSGLMNAYSSAYEVPKPQTAGTDAPQQGSGGGMPGSIGTGLDQQSQGQDLGETG